MADGGGGGWVRGGQRVGGRGGVEGRGWRRGGEGGRKRRGRLEEEGTTEVYGYGGGREREDGGGEVRRRASLVW